MLVEGGRAAEDWHVLRVEGDGSLVLVVFPEEDDGIIDGEAAGAMSGLLPML